MQCVAALVWNSVLLYDSQISGNCYKVRLLLAQLGVEYELRDVDVVERAQVPVNAIDYSDRAGVLGDVNPALRVPTVVLDDGRPLAESNAILCYFAEGTPYLPEDRFERAKVLQWLFFEQFSHEPYLAGVRFLVSYWSGPPLTEQIEWRRAAGYVALKAMEQHLATRSFLVVEQYTIADIGLYAYTHVAEEGGFDLSMFPAIGAWLNRVAEQPGHVPMMA
jgi:glutathione S-transferase